jgi:hypothetical protein
MNTTWARPRSGRLGIGMIVAAFVLVLSSCALLAEPAGALSPSFGVEGTGAGEISREPTGVAVEQESGDVYIADRNNSRVDKFGPEGEFLLAWGWAVADGSTEASQTCTTTCFGGFPGPPFSGFGTGQFKSIEGIAVDNDPLSPSHGDVYVADPGSSRVQKFSPQGEFILMFGGEVNATTKGDVCLAGEECQAGVPGTGPGEFTALSGRAIAVDSSGKVYVADENRVQLFSEAGAAESEIAIPGAERIESLAVDSAKDIYLAGSQLLGVHKYDNTGKELGLPRDEPGENTSFAITIGPADTLFVNDFRGESHHLLSYDAAGAQTSSFDAGARAEDGLRGIAYSNVLKTVYVLNQGKVRIVTPPPPGPLVLNGSESAGKIEPTTAELGAAINPEGSAPTSYHFEFGPTTAYGESSPEESLTGGAFEDQAALAALTGLQPNTTYHFRVVATNGAETTFGPDATFTTLPPVSIDQTSVSQVNATSARLEAELNPHGEVTEYHFDYGTTVAYGTTIPIPDASAGSGTTDTTVTNPIQDLAPSTTYHYRVVAHNGLGVVVGPDRSFTTQGASSTLPDGRVWELVSPPNKHGSPLEPLTEEGGIIQAAATGGGIAYVSLGPINGDPKGVRSPHDSQLVSTRSSEGWSTQDITTPHEEISIIRPGFPSEYKIFSEDLQLSAVEPQGSTPLSPQTTERTAYSHQPDGEFMPLVTAANVPTGTKFGGIEAPEGTGQFSNGIEVRTATPDLDRILFASPQALTSGFEPGFEATGRQNLYEYAGGALRLVSVLPNGEPIAQAGVSAGVGSNDLNMRGAISTDGERVVFESGNGEELYLRDLGLGQTVKLNEVHPGASGGTGRASFQVANSDASKVFFTDAARLTTDATAQPGKPDLYMCAIDAIGGNLSCALSDLTADHNLGEAADVRTKVSAIDATGEHVYFAANGILTNTPNAAREHALAGDCENETKAGSTCNFYEYDTTSKQTSLIAVLSSADSPDWGGHGNLHVLGNLTARSSPNGRFLSFMSRRSLTGYDNHDVNNGQADEEVFLFDSASGSISCVSCNPTGARPIGVFDKESFPGLLVDHPQTWIEKTLAGSIPGWTLGPSLNVALHQSRYLSDSGRMFFNAADALVPQDTNKVEDVYQYEPPGTGDCTSSSQSFSSVSGGCVNLISSGGSKEESTFLDASESGDEVFFLTDSRLTANDVDGALDVYDAHVCSASSPCPPLPPAPAPACDGDACQNPGSPPSDATPGSLTYKGPANASPPPAVAPPKPKAKPLTRTQLLARALKSCKKDKAKKKRVACEKQARKKYGPTEKSKAKTKARAKRAGHAQKARG